MSHQRDRFEGALFRPSVSVMYLTINLFQIRELAEKAKQDASLKMKEPGACSGSLYKRSRMAVPEEIKQ